MFVVFFKPDRKYIYYNDSVRALGGNLETIKAENPGLFVYVGVCLCQNEELPAYWRDAQVCELTFLPGARTLSAMSNWTQTDGKDVSCGSGLITSLRAHARW